MGNKMALDIVRQEIEELDYNAGMEYCAEDEEFYIEMLVDYATNGRLEKLKEYYNNRDWTQYEIEVHALKSTSRMMGLSALGDKCEVLQTAAGNKDESILLTKHDEMMSDYTKYIEVLRRELM